MTAMRQQRLASGEDWFAIPVNGWQAMTALQSAAIDQAFWEAVVAGQSMLTLRYDPAKVTYKQARAAALALVESSDRKAPDIAVQHHSLPLHIDTETAPDITMVTEQLGIAPQGLAAWLSDRVYRVSLAGFQPGFAYLEDMGEDSIPDLPRLATPRLTVAAGSFGLRGRQACLYAHNGPGGWPIVGRTNTSLFTPDNRRSPALLSIGDTVAFTIISDDDHGSGATNG
ncbi:MAG: carboxyltransferase domain-containing protein [Pseudomonadota bacterium]